MGYTGFHCWHGIMATCHTLTVASIVDWHNITWNNMSPVGFLSQPQISDLDIGLRQWGLASWCKGNHHVWSYPKACDNNQIHDLSILLHFVDSAEACVTKRHVSQHRWEIWYFRVRTKIQKPFPSAQKLLIQKYINYISKIKAHKRQARGTPMSLDDWCDLYQS